MEPQDNKPSSDEQPTDSPKTTEPADSSSSAPTDETISAPSTESVAPASSTVVAPADAATSSESDSVAAVPAGETASSDDDVATGVVQPSVNAPIVSGGGDGGSKKRLVLGVIVVAVLVVLLAGGYVFGIYLPSRPNSLYETGLTRTGQALDALVSYSGNVTDKGYKSYDVTGSLQSTGSASFDAKLTGAVAASGNATLKVNADVLGEKVNANLEGVHVAGSNTPDVYVQLSGIKQGLDSLGLSKFDSLDGEWVSVDHTLISSLAASFDQSVSGAASGSVLPTGAEVHDAEVKIQTVNKQYIFTTDASKAVLTNEKFVGKETKDGRATDHYVLGYNKDHLEAYVDALGTALDSSSLNSWSKTANNGKDLSEVLNIAALKKSVASANASYAFDAWIDTSTKLFHSVQFTDPSDKGTIFTLSQGYTGGSNYPFVLGVTTKDPSSGATQSASLDFAFNTSTNKSTGRITDVQDGTNLTLNFALTPSKNDVSVTAPTGAKPITDVLSELGLSNSTSLK